MARRRTPGLTPREAQILHLLWTQGSLTVGQIQRALPDPPTPNTVRKLLSIMGQRQLVVDDGRGYGKCYTAAIEARDSRGEALRILVETLYDGQGGDVVGDLLTAGLLTKEQLRALASTRTRGVRG
ncbi:MAG: hypothetical protein HN712_05950 [Gemmatimonadetes bacterium]|jgi:BlaI family transcriptional regulator, penicillinase repressor|nr:hypothetical protein [Gemmatimonadota bacterium]MBT7859834.1 hypothetical protein [Gemmatimonadota bacterium]